MTAFSECQGRRFESCRGRATAAPHTDQACATSPAVAGFIGAGSASDAARYTKQMYEITIGRNADWTMPNLDFAGVPTGIDIRKVLRTGIAPVINTGMAHKMPGIGQVGAGIVRAPLACFERALEGVAEALGVQA